MKIIIIYTTPLIPGQFFKSDKIKECLMCATCGIHELGESYTQHSGRILMEGKCLRCLNVNGRLVLNYDLNE